MKLYYTPGVCSLAPHIALREAGADFDLVQVDLRAKKIEDGADYLAVSELGKVPALDIGEDTVLTENAAILQYIADQNPSANLAPAANSKQRYRLQSWLSFLGAELHKPFGPLFQPGHSEEAKEMSRSILHKHFAMLDRLLSKQAYLLGDSFTVADAYLFVILGWPRVAGLDMSAYPALGAYAGKIAAREPVQAALKAEGLV